MNFLTNLTPSPIDTRDFRYIELPGPYPTEIDLRPFVYEIEDQGLRGTCASNGVGSAIELICKRAGQPFDVSRLFLDWHTRNMEGRLGTEGVAIRDVFKVGQKFGVCSEDIFPYDLKQNWNIEPPADAKAAALLTPVRRYEKLFDYNDHDLTWQQKVRKIESALTEGFPVIIGMQVTNQIRTLTGPWQTHRYQPLSSSNPSIGGHCMVIAGSSRSNFKCIDLNSWGANWGDSGYWGMDYTLVNEPFFEAWIVRSFADVDIKEAPGIKLEWRNQYNIKARIAPRPEEVGMPANIWMGAKVPGVGIRLKQGLDGNNWVPFDGTNFPPTGQVVLDDPTLLSVASMSFDLPSIPAGTEVYVGYGQTPLDWNLQLIATL